ncbi:amidase [Aliikangiella maris]|uniref:Amidase n=2 Tax=Aliikangiella maris TaxID=3162458 RepID=A0ABV2BX57_9GAMM
MFSLSRQPVAQPSAPGKLIKWTLLSCFTVMLWGCQNQAPQQSNSASRSVSHLPAQLVSDLKSATAFSPRITTSTLPDNIKHATIPQLTRLMEQGKLTAAELTNYYLQQIAQYNQHLNAVIKVNPKAIEIAQQLDTMRQSGNVLGPLHGIPILVKDNVETSTMPTTAGSLILANNMTKRDAPIVTKLKAAGAIILGKTNLSEWANMRSERSSSGWSAVGGQTRNPHNLHRSTCGSSSGSGASIAAFMAVAAIGTETNGSITCPSSANGLVGIKPTVGLLSRTAIVPISHSQDTAGPMTRSVVDAAILLQVMQGIDPQDEATQINQKHFSKDFISNLQQPLQQKRIGVLFSDALEHEAVLALFEQFKQKIANQTTLVNDLNVNYYNGFYADSYEVLLYEFKHTLNHYFAKLPNALNTLTMEKLIAFNQQHTAQEMPYFQQEILVKSQAKGDLTDTAYIEALKKVQQATRQDGIDNLMNTHQLDAIMTVTLSPAWTIDRINGDHYIGGYSGLSAISGYPHITIPLGKVHGMPVGLSIAGKALSEAELIAIAYQLEKQINYDYNIE